MIFGKKNENPETSEFKRDSRKARRFFDHAQVVSDSRNYDYAIECYINGLRHEPDNMAVQEALREVALKRKIAGGKPAGFALKLKKAGKDPIEKLMRAEMLWAKDPVNVALLLDVMALAVEANDAEEDLDLAPLALWIGGIVLDANQAAKNTSKNVYVKTRDLFARINAFSKAVQACRLAVQLDPENASLLHDLKNLEAELAMQEGGYTATAGEADGFRSMVKDLDKQRRLENQDAITKTVSVIDEEIRHWRSEYEEDPQDADRIMKLVTALLRKETDKTEEEAVGLLEAALEQTGQYRHKMRIGDIRIKQMNRRLRPLQAHVKNNPQDEASREKYQAILEQKLQFEHDEFAQRVKNYPTDLGLRYELGRRLFALQKFDDAIGAFQQAKVDPKHRVASLDYLGRCYAARGWFDEAVDTLRQGIEAHAVSDDLLAKELRYQLMMALKQLATKNKSPQQARDAQKIASQVLQTDINFRDIRKQMDEIRQLVDDLDRGKQPVA